MELGRIARREVEVGVTAWWATVPTVEQGRWREVCPFFLFLSFSFFFLFSSSFPVCCSREGVLWTEFSFVSRFHFCLQSPNFNGGSFEKG